jgi:hypothetical protein
VSAVTGSGLCAGLERAFPGHPVWEEAGSHYEALRRRVIEDYERAVRRKLAVPRRWNAHGLLAATAAHARWHLQPDDVPGDA